jgi:hypothetical protein
MDYGENRNPAPGTGGIGSTYGKRDLCDPDGTPTPYTRQHWCTEGGKRGEYVFVLPGVIGAGSNTKAQIRFMVGSALTNPTSSGAIENWTAANLTTALAAAAPASYGCVAVLGNAYNNTENADVWGTGNNTAYLPDGGVLGTDDATLTVTDAVVTCRTSNFIDTPTSYPNTLKITLLDYTELSDGHKTLQIGYPQNTVKNKSACKTLTEFAMTTGYDAASADAWTEPTSGTAPDLATDFRCDLTKIGK